MSASITTTLNHGVTSPSLDRDEQSRGNADGQPFRGIALGVVLSVPLWLLLAWTVHAVI